MWFLSVRARQLPVSFRQLKSFAAAEAGAVVLWVGLGAPVVMGLGGLGLDVANWFLDRRVMQSASDTAAIAAAHALNAGRDQTEIEAAVAESLANSGYGFRSGDTVLVRTPPASGLAMGDPNAVEVVLGRRAHVMLSSTFIGDGVPIRTRGVGGVVVVGEHCILALDETMDSALEFTGTANADINCGVAANSSSNRAIHVGGQASLTADPAQAFGDIFVEGTASLMTEHPPQPYSPKVPDPFGPEGRNLTVPPTQACEPVPTLEKGLVNVVSPGWYCGDFLIENKDVAFEPGIYVIDGGDFRIKAGSNVDGDGVTFILTATYPEDIGIVEFTSNSTIDLVAPDWGEYAGILIFIDPRATSFDSYGNMVENMVLGGASATLNGAIYAPTREILFTGGATGSGKCLQLVGRKVTITGNTVIHNDPSVCAALSLDEIQQVRIRLVE